MNVDEIVQIIKSKGEPMTLKEIYEGYKEMFDVSEHVDYTDAIRTYINGNTMDRVLNHSNTSIFYFCFPKNTKGQK